MKRPWAIVVLAALVLGCKNQQPAATTNPFTRTRVPPPITQGPVVEGVGPGFAPPPSNLAPLSTSPAPLLPPPLGAPGTPPPLSPPPNNPAPLMAPPINGPQDNRYSPPGSFQFQSQLDDTKRFFKDEGTTELALDVPQDREPKPARPASITIESAQVVPVNAVADALRLSASPQGVSNASFEDAVRDWSPDQSPFDRRETAQASRPAAREPEPELARLPQRAARAEPVSNDRRATPATMTTESEPDFPAAASYADGPSATPVRMSVSAGNSSSVRIVRARETERPLESDDDDDFGAPVPLPLASAPVNEASNAGSPNPVLRIVAQDKPAPQVDSAWTQASRPMEPPATSQVRLRTDSEQAAQPDPEPVRQARRPQAVFANAESVSAPQQASDPLPAAEPQPEYAHTQDYSTLRGRLEYSASQRQWKLRYIPIDGETDQYGGSVVLTEAHRLDSLQAGQFVAVRGGLAANAAPTGSFSPAYRLEAIEPAGR